MHELGRSSANYVAVTGAKEANADASDDTVLEQNVATFATMR